MKFTKWLLAATVMGLFCASEAKAQEAHRHQHDRSEKLGQVNFPVSCSAAAQKQFNRAVAMLHSFRYEVAEKAFSEVTLSATGEPR